MISWADAQGPRIRLVIEYLDLSPRSGRSNQTLYESGYESGYASVTRRRALLRTPLLNAGVVCSTQLH